MAGAYPIIAVDVATSKFSALRALGATHCVDPTAADAVQQILEISGGGVDFAFVTTSAAPAFGTAMRSLAARGTCVLIAGFPDGATLQFDPGHLLNGERRIIASKYGSSNPPVDFPDLVGLYLAGRLPLEAMVSRRWRANQVDEAYDALRAGNSARGLIVFDDFTDRARESGRTDRRTVPRRRATDMRAALVESARSDRDRRSARSGTVGGRGSAGGPGMRDLRHRPASGGRRTRWRSVPAGAGPRVLGRDRRTGNRCRSVPGRRAGGRRSITALRPMRRCRRGQGNMCEHWGALGATVNGGWARVRRRPAGESVSAGTVVSVGCGRADRTGRLRRARTGAVGAARRRTGGGVRCGDNGPGAHPVVAVPGSRSGDGDRPEPAAARTGGAD